MGAIRPTPNDKMNPEQIRMTVRYVAAVGNNAVTFRKYSLRILAETRTYPRKITHRMIRVLAQNLIACLWNAGQRCSNLS